MKPFISAHRGGDCFATENSLGAVKQSLAYKPDIIELDVRKSEDGILYCFHGNFLEFLFPKIFLTGSFSLLRKKKPTLTTLKELAQVVGKKSILFLDIKDYSISFSEIKDVLIDIPTLEIWIAAQNIDYLRAFPSPTSWKKVCNGGVLWLKPRFSEVGSTSSNYFFGIIPQRTKPG